MAGMAKAKRDAMCANCHGSRVSEDRLEPCARCNGSGDEPIDVATAFVPAGQEPAPGDLLVRNARAWKAERVLREQAKRGG